MLIIGYRYESALGKDIVKAVICNNESEYRKMKQKIEDGNMELIEFDQVYKACTVLSR